MNEAAPDFIRESGERRRERTYDRGLEEEKGEGKDMQAGTPPCASWRDTQSSRMHFKQQPQVHGWSPGMWGVEQVVNWTGL